MRRADYGKQLGAAAQALQEKIPEQVEEQTCDGRVVSAIAATGSYAEAARVISGQTFVLVTPGQVRAQLKKVAKQHGVALPKMPHTVKPEPDGIAKIAAALGRMAAGLKAALGSKPKRKRKGAKR